MDLFLLLVPPLLMDILLRQTLIRTLYLSMKILSMIVLAEKDPHFIHLNVCSLPHKILEISKISEMTHAGLICANETCLTSSIEDCKVNIDGYWYIISRKGRNRNVGDADVYAHKDLVF